MPKIKMPRGNPSLDMTPMVDLAFLLVTFFMLTASVRVSEPVIVDPPSSASDKLLPDNVILITVDPKGKPFFNINNYDVRVKTLEQMGQQYKIAFTAKEKERFGKMTSFGVPMAQLKEYINMDDPQAQKEKAKTAGREFKYEPLRFAIKADGEANYIAVKQVIKVFTDKELFRFNLITNLEGGDVKK